MSLQRNHIQFENQFIQGGDYGDDYEYDYTYMMMMLMLMMPIGRLCKNRVMSRAGTRVIQRGQLGVDEYACDDDDDDVDDDDEEEDGNDDDDDDDDAKIGEVMGRAGTGVERSREANLGRRKRTKGYHDDDYDEEDDDDYDDDDYDEDDD